MGGGALPRVDAQGCVWHGVAGDVGGVANRRPFFGLFAQDTLLVRAAAHSLDLHTFPPKQTKHRFKLYCSTLFIKISVSEI